MNASLETTRTLRRDFAMLSASGLKKNYGGLCAVSDFNMDLRPNELVGLIGPNGAGKTTVFNLLTGLETLDAGQVKRNNFVISGLKPHRISHRGLAP